LGKFAYACVNVVPTALRRTKLGSKCSGRVLKSSAMMNLMKGCRDDGRHERARGKGEGKAEGASGLHGFALPPPPVLRAYTTFGGTLSCPVPSGPCPAAAAAVDAAPIKATIKAPQSARRAEPAPIPSPVPREQLRKCIEAVHPSRLAPFSQRSDEDQWLLCVATRNGTRGQPIAFLARNNTQLAYRGDRNFP
jgi:hypothetical protein